MFELTDVPDKRWVELSFDILLDDGKVKPQFMRLQILVKTIDELKEMRDEAIAKLRKEIDEGRDRKPSEGIHLEFTKSLIVDWEGVYEDGLMLPFNEANWRKVIKVQEAQSAIVKKVMSECKREDLIQGNSKSLENGMPHLPS